jgi:hypothetical protein
MRGPRAGRCVMVGSALSLLRQIGLVELAGVAALEVLGVDRLSPAEEVAFVLILKLLSCTRYLGSGVGARFHCSQAVQHLVAALPVAEILEVWLGLMVLHLDG